MRHLVTWFIVTFVFICDSSVSFSSVDSSCSDELREEVESLLLAERNCRKKYNEAWSHYVGQIKSCKSFLSVLRSEGSTRIAAWKAYLDRELANRKPQESYKKEFGSIFAPPDVVTSSLDLLVSEKAKVTQILELEAGYGFNAVYAASHPMMEKATWKCFDSKENEDHPWFQEAKYFSPSEKTNPLCVLDGSQNFRHSVLALLNPLKSEEEYTEIVKRFKAKKGKYLLILADKNFKMPWLNTSRHQVIRKKISQRFEGEDPKILFFFIFRS